MDGDTEKLAPQFSGGVGRQTLPGEMHSVRTGREGDVEAVVYGDGGSVFMGDGEYFVRRLEEGEGGDGGFLADLNDVHAASEGGMERGGLVALRLFTVGYEVYVVVLDMEPPSFAEA